MNSTSHEHARNFKISPEAATRDKPVVDCGVWEAQWVYERADGRPFFIHEKRRLKNGKKICPYKHWKNHQEKHRKPDGADAILLYLPDVIDAVRNGETVVWCEGEKDADAVTLATGILATSHHQGAEVKASIEQAEWFRGHKGLILLAYDLDPDDPETGGNVGAADLIHRYNLLEAVGVPRTQIGVIHAATRKDMADHFEAGRTWDEVVPVRDLTDLRLKAARTTRRATARGGYPRSSS